MNTFSIGETIRFAWETFKKRPWIFVGATLIIFVVNMLVGAFVESFDEGPIAIIGFIVNIAASTLVGLGMTAFYLKAHDAVENADLKHLWHPQDFWKYLGATLLNGLAVLVAFIPFIVALLITVGTSMVMTGTTADLMAQLGALTIVLAFIGLVIGIYIASMLMFGTYAVVDRALGPIAALKESIRITKGNRLKIIGFLVVGLLLNILGAIALFVGLLVTIPMLMIGIVHVYRTLSPRAPSPTTN